MLHFPSRSPASDAYAPSMTTGTPNLKCLASFTHSEEMIDTLSQICITFTYLFMVRLTR